jgi:hypothetical protein
MKRTIKILLLLMTLSGVSILEGLAQGKGGPPPWAPAHGYRAKTRHIYFPEHNFYFDVQRGVYIYLSGSSWIINAKLPVGISMSKLNSAMKVELDLNTDSPFKFNSDHKVKYKAKPGGPPPGHQKNGHPGNGNGHGNGKGKGKG